MADQPSIHVDTDWKKQAQEEKRRLAEQEQQRRASQPPPPPPPRSPAVTQPAEAEADEMPAADLGTIVQLLTTQALFYMGELAGRGREPVLNLDMAKHNIDLLAVLEEKTRNNLTPEEKKLLDNALYEVRMRFVSLASQVASYP